MGLFEQKDRYLSDYREVPEARIGKRPAVKYIYAADWYLWGLDDQAAAKRRILYPLMEAVSLCLYVWAALRRVPFNQLKVVGGFGMLSLLAWAVELWGVFSFLINRAKLTRRTYETTDRHIREGSFIHAVLLLISTLSGIISAPEEGALRADAIPVMLAYLAVCAIAFGIWRLQRTLYCRTEKNTD